MKCPQCMHDNRDSAKFCEQCGERFASQAQPKTTISTNAGAIAADGGVAVTGGAGVGGDVHGSVIIAKGGASLTFYAGEKPITMPAMEQSSTLGGYLTHLISLNRYLQLQGIRSGGRLINIELDRIYIRLRASQTESVQPSKIKNIEELDKWFMEEPQARERFAFSERYQQGEKIWTVRTNVGERLSGRHIETMEKWLREEWMLAPGERLRLDQQEEPLTETVTVSVEKALAANRRMVILGDPGSGKTTLLRYLTLIYARDLAENTLLVHEGLGLDESGWLPILLPLRKLGAYLRSHHPIDDGTEGHARLLKYLVDSFEQERIHLPSDFFDKWLTNGKAVVLLDGLDEVADQDLRRRVSRLVDGFVRAYHKCRYVVTCRIVGYTGAARLGEAFTIMTVRDFSLTDIEEFLTNWHRMVAVGQMGTLMTVESFAVEQTRHLMHAILKNERIRELAINPLMLTVIALVHRDRVKLPDRRAELYAEAIDVLLGKWDDGKGGVLEIPIYQGKSFDVGDKRVILQTLALHMHERQLREIELVDLRAVFNEHFGQDACDRKETERATDRFLKTIEERTGLLLARGEGVYGFSHLTFQEYLAALAVASRDDYVPYTLSRVADPWWREVILLEAGYLSTQGKERTTRLIQAIANLPQEEELYHNMVLAAECLRDAGSNRVLGNVELDIRTRLRKELEPRQSQKPSKSLFSFLSRGIDPEKLAQQRKAAARALGRVGSDRFWSLPHGEPEWVTIPAGQFWMGTEHRQEMPKHRLHLESFRISRAPITNAQYQLFVHSSGHKSSANWEGATPLRGRGNHPVSSVNWHDAMVYCRWLSEMTKQLVTLPSEAEWEKAARGDGKPHIYPWGDVFDPVRCNCKESQFEETTPVGIFLAGASPYGCLDMVGNVWEWTRSLWGEEFEEPQFKYPYNPGDGREELEASGKVWRVLRGGSFQSPSHLVGCGTRGRFVPHRADFNYGFRVVAFSTVGQ